MALAGCSAPNHLGNPLLLPLGALTTAAENARYDARRAQVKRLVVAHEVALRRGQAPEGLWRVAQVPPARRADVLAQLRALPPGDWAEEATIVLMVHS